MAENKNSFILYKDLIYTVEKLPKEKQADLFMHILKYVNDENPETDDFIIELAFEPIKRSLKRDLVKYKKTCEKNKENANMRWHKKNATALNEMQNNASVCERIQPNANDADSDSDSDSDSDNDSDIVLLKKEVDFYESDKAFLTDFNKARRHYMHIDTDITSLTAIEKMSFREIQHSLKIEEIRSALQGMYEQRELYEHSKIRPTHFLKNVELYRDAKRGKLQLFEAKQKKSDRL